MKRYFIVKNEELVALEKDYEAMSKKVNDFFRVFAGFTSRCTIPRLCILTKPFKIPFVKA